MDEIMKNSVLDFPSERIRLSLVCRKFAELEYTGNLIKQKYGNNINNYINNILVKHFIYECKICNDYISRMMEEKIRYVIGKKSRF